MKGQDIQMDCIKYKCKYYFNSDIFEKCTLADRLIIGNRCSGLSQISHKKEAIICKISKLNQELDKLNELKNEVKKFNNQN